MVCGSGDSECEYSCDYLYIVGGYAKKWYVELLSPTIFYT